MTPQPSAQEVVRRIVEAAAPYEFRSFLVGLDRALMEESGEPAGAAARRLKSSVGAELHRRWPGRAVDFRHPEVRFVVRPDLAVECHPAPLFLAGRYRKLSRAIPASRWMHMPCRGRGCADCRYTGDICGPSVQELFEEPLLAATGGGRCFFHGLGREDTDARMLGRGRPFVLEVEAPRRRSIDLGALVEAASRAGEGRCELLRPAVVERTAVDLVKTAAADKTYRAWIRLDGPPPGDASARLEPLDGALVEQLSPTRVMHRRGRDKMRPKRVVSCRWLGEVDGLWLWNVRAESGTYIKEFVSGDEGRTQPSWSGHLGVPCRVTALDVMGILDDATPG